MATLMLNTEHGSDSMLTTSPLEHHRRSPSPEEPTTPTGPTSPVVPTDHHLSMASLSSMGISESDIDLDDLSPEQLDQCLSTPRVSGVRHARKPSSLEILQNVWAPPERQSTLFDASKDTAPETPMPESDDGNDAWARHSEELAGFQFEVTALGDDDETEATLSKSTASDRGSFYSYATPRRSNSTEDSDHEVDWQKLERTEQQEKTDKEIPEGAVDDSTAFLLARLEQENAVLTNDPKAVNKTVTRVRKSRPPSMAQLRKLVSQGDTGSVRYSVASTMSLPDDPPPMTELEFWAALVQDYPSTAVRLPTLTTSKIRAGIPPPLRGIVWTSIAGARDKRLEQSFQNLLGEKSPYEGIINKDVGRSFPGVELFREADGEGQRMLGRVLKCFSLHDKDIGYCQGMGFLVGPLLMNMPEQEAFCVLVRLMDHYSLRPSFLPSLSGLHMRIYQFSALLTQLHPELSEHLTSMGVEPAYLSQWFLSCFAVTCPLAMLFRIYDVIFAEGANETVMRVALALMRRNEKTLLEATEFEEIMQLLLGRSLWDCYACNSDDLVEDFTSLGNVITHARLAELERDFDTKSGEAVGEKAGFLPEVQAAASRFLGRLWAPSHSHTPSKSTNTLSPPSAEKDFRSAFLRRSPSKQSISTINDGVEGSSTGSASMASTAATETDVDTMRDSTTDGFRSKSGSVRTMSVNLAASQNAGTSMSREDRDLHNQIEDLLTALSGMQREHADLTSLLQREREERTEDHRLMKRLVDRLRPEETEQGETSAADRRRTLPPPERDATEVKFRPMSQPPQSRDDFTGLLHLVQDRLSSNARLSSSFETKAQIKSMLSRVREQLEREEKRSRELTLRIEDAEAIVLTYSAESDDLRVEVEELRRRVNDEFQERQKLEQTIRDQQNREHSKARRSVLIRAESMNELPIAGRIESSPTAGLRKSSVSSAPAAAPNGLREFRLRRDSSSSVQSNRSVRMSLSMRDSLPRIQTSHSAGPSSPSMQPQTASSAATSPQAPGHQRGLTVPSIATGGSFGGRTSSLATQKVLATPEHEPAAEEALLLELVNAKTAEALARQEVDELRRSLAVQRRKQEETLRLAQAETQSFKAQAAALQAEVDARTAKDAAIAAEAERKRLEAERVKAAALADERGIDHIDTHVDDMANRDPKTAPATSSGWLWAKRTLSTTTASIMPKSS